MVESPESYSENIPYGSPRFRAPIVYTIAIAILAALWFYVFFSLSKQSPLSTKSIAVLPFLNENGNSKDDYFVNSVSEHIGKQLSKIPGITLIPPQLIAHFAATNKTAVEIGKDLNATYVLVGSVNREEDEGELEGRMIAVEDSRQVWSGTFQFRIKTLLDVEDEIASDLVEAAGIKLTEDMKALINQKPSTNPEAYNYYIKGREYYNLYSNVNNEKAIAMFRNALQSDPSFALAYAGMGDAFSERALEYGYPAVCLDTAIDMCNKSLSLDPDLAEAHKALGMVFYSKGQLHKALEQWAKAIEINPYYTEAINNFGVVLSIKGDLAEALKWIKKGIELDPTHPRGYVSEGSIYSDLGFDSLASSWFARAEGMDPRNLDVHVYRAFAFMYHNEYAQSVRESKKALEIDSTNPAAVECAGYAEYLAGNKDAAMNYFAQNAKTDTSSEGIAALYSLLVKKNRIAEANALYTHAELYWKNSLNKGDEGFYIPFNLAALYAVSNNKDAAFEWLSKAANAGWIGYRWIQIDPAFDGMRNDERFRKLVNDAKHESLEQMNFIRQNDAEELP